MAPPATSAEPPPPAAAWSRGRKLVVLAITVAALSAALSAGYNHPSTQLFFMRFFRDVARARAHARLHGNAQALQVMLGDDEVLLQAATLRRPFGSPGDASEPAIEAYAADTGVTFTAEELARFNGEDDAPLYLAVRGRVYDVSARPGFYGPRRAYHCLTAKDATRALATGCKKPQCLVASVVGLTEKEKREADRWVDFFERHDKYHFVGKMVPDPVADMIQRRLLEEKAAKRVATEILTEEDQLASAVEKAQRVSDVAQRDYAQGNHDEAVVLWSAAVTMLEEADGDEAEEATSLRAQLRRSRAAVWQKQGRLTRASEEYTHVIDMLIGTTNPADKWTLARTLSDQASLFGHQALVDVIMAEKARAGYAAALALYSRLETLPDTTRENRARQRNEEARTLFAALTLDLEMQPCVGSEVASCAATRAAAMDRLHTLCKGAGAPSACQGILEELTTMETLAAVEQLGKMQQDASKVMVGEVPSARVPAAAVPADDASGKVGADPVTAKASVESVAPTEGGAPFESETPAESKAPTH